MSDDHTRQQQRQLSPGEQAFIHDLKQAFNQMITLVEGGGGDARCKAIAKTKLEEAAMWAVKGLTA